MRFDGSAHPAYSDVELHSTSAAPSPGGPLMEASSATTWILGLLLLLVLGLILFFIARYRTLICYAIHDVFDYSLLSNRDAHAELVYRFRLENSFTREVSVTTVEVLDIVDENSDVVPALITIAEEHPDSDYSEFEDALSAVDN